MNSRKTRIRAAIYARVSTLDKSQDPKTQLRPLREYADRRGFTVVAEFVDRASGRADDRLNYQALREAVRRRATDIVLVWRYDRFARSTHALITALSEFNSLGVDFISLQEGIDTTTRQGKLVFTIMAGLAEFESSLIGDRVRAGMARARAEGKHVGRAALDDAIVAQIVALKRQGKSVSLIQHELGVSRGVIVKYSKGVRGLSCGCLISPPRRSHEEIPLLAPTGSAGNLRKEQSVGLNGRLGADSVEKLVLAAVTAR